MKIGLDCHVCKAVRRALAEYTVVQAEDGKSDESWFKRGKAAGMTHIYFHDEDLYDLCESDDSVVFINARSAQAFKNQMKTISKVTGVKL